MTPQIIDSAKLTERLISSYCTALEKMSLTPLQRQRLKRLRKLAELSSLGITLEGDAIPDLLSLPAVKDILSAAKEQAAKSALEDRRAALNELDNSRVGLEAEVTTLRAEALRLRDEIGASQREQNVVLASFDERVQKKFEAIGQDASSFLAEVAVVRAALSGPVSTRPSGSSTKVSGERTDAQALGLSQVVTSLREHFDNAGLGCVLPVTLLASWASGYVPMAFGLNARDAFAATGDCFFGGRVHVATLGPTLSSPTDMLRLPVSSSDGMSTVEELLSDASASEDLFLLVFDNINLCQLDSTLVPLFRNYVGVHGRPSAVRLPAR